MNKEFEKKLSEKADPEKAKLLQRFFKTGKGEYGEGDIFIGIIVPELRKIAKEFAHIDINEIEELIDSQVHERRMIALFILIKHYEKACKENKGVLLEKDFVEKRKKEIFEFYLRKAKENRINNWDLVDLSSPNIVGKYLIDKKRDILYKLAKTGNLWEKRISILATFTFIRDNDFMDGLEIARILLKDNHDLIHKAVGWMLREIGKRDIRELRSFLKKHYKEMPRTMLRYAIEKMNEIERQKYLKGKCI